MSRTYFLTIYIEREVEKRKHYEMLNSCVDSDIQYQSHEKHGVFIVNFTNKNYYDTHRSAEQLYVTAICVMLKKVYSNDIAFLATCHTYIHIYI